MSSTNRARQARWRHARTARRSSRSSCRTRSGPRSTRRPTAAAQPSQITHLRELELGDKCDNGRWGALDIIPTKADYVLDLIRLNSLWPLLSGPGLLRDRDDVGAPRPRTTWTASTCSPSAPARARRTCSSSPGTLTTKMAGPLRAPVGADARAQVVRRDGRLHLLGRALQALVRDGRGDRPDHAGRRLRARLSAAAGGLIYGMMKLQQLIRERRGHWAERTVGPTVPIGV